MSSVAPSKRSTEDPENQEHDAPPSVDMPDINTLRPEIRDLFLKNRTSDLRRFMWCNCCLNMSNFWLVYHYYAFHVLGGFLIALGESLDLPILRYIGLGINMLSILFRIYVDFNNAIITRQRAEIMNIRMKKYVDEGILATIDKKPELK